jgi:tetratricopeptide (TPR) repeat protein
MERAKRLDPFSIGINWFLGTAYGLAGRYDEALEKAHDLIELEPNFWGGHWMVGYSYTSKGEYPKAVAAYQKAGELDASPMIKGALAHCYALWGKPDAARAILKELRELEKQSYIPPFYLAMIYGALGENDEAFAYLEKAYELHDSSLPLIKVDERLASLRSDPRLQDMMLRIGLTP